MFGKGGILFEAPRAVLLVLAAHVVVLVAERERLVALLEVRVLELRERYLTRSRALERLPECGVRRERWLALELNRVFLIMDNCF